MYHGVSYVKKIPVMCRLHGQKHMLFRQHVTTLFPEKVGAGTLGHPVLPGALVPLQIRRRAHVSSKELEHLYLNVTCSQFSFRDWMTAIGKTVSTTI